MSDEKDHYSYNYYFNFRLFLFLLPSNMVYASSMISPLKKFSLMFFWMGIAAFSVISADLYFSIPDEISGVLYFISIGIAASAVLNYYRN